ncbi:MAG: hypothetical protein B6D34_10605 [Candidatus Brocadia sp. UTAMX1]|nr:MAG: hypothetical protein B6D34_10605 [Candidatus Brocadia sp. UTAMX1]
MRFVQEGEFGTDALSDVYSEEAKQTEIIKGILERNRRDRFVSVRKSLLQALNRIAYPESSRPLRSTRKGSIAFFFCLGMSYRIFILA